jgi:hypothetical protein
MYEIVNNSNSVVAGADFRLKFDELTTQGVS